MATLMGPGADQKRSTHASEAGNLSIAHYGTYTAAGAAEDDVILLSRIPKGADVYGLHYSHAALGADNGLTFGYVPVDGSSAGDPDAFATVADASVAGKGLVAVAPFTTDRELYVVALKTGTGTATGRITAQALYNFTNAD